jgi:hypothetical protein
MKALRLVYPSVVGLLLGLLQTGLFFQLSFTLSSSFQTFLMVTICWLIGSAAGIRFGGRLALPLNAFLLLALLSYFAIVALLGAAPYNTGLWPLYAALIVVTGLYAGQFFAQAGRHYSAQQLFFRENNGFILGLVGGTILFLLFGRLALWAVPVLVAACAAFCTRSVLGSGQPPVSANLPPAGFEAS